MLLQALCFLAVLCEFNEIRTVIVTQRECSLQSLVNFAQARIASQIRSSIQDKILLLTGISPGTYNQAPFRQSMLTLCVTTLALQIPEQDVPNE